MNYSPKALGPAKAGLIITISIFVAFGLIIIFSSLALSAFVSPTTEPVSHQLPPETSLTEPITHTPTLLPTASPTVVKITPTPSATAMPSPIPPTFTPSPTRPTPTPSLTPTPTRDLAGCNVAGCGALAVPLPTVAYSNKLLMTEITPRRRDCPECPRNEHLSPAELDRLVGADAETLAELREIALSQQPYQIAPGIIYIVADYVHYVVVDLKESGFRMRNIIPPVPDPVTRETVRITPSYCLNHNSLVVTSADYYGLVSSNKTETGRDVFFHLGRAALFQRDGRFDIDVIRTRSAYERVTLSWGAGPIFIWNGQFDFDPEQEWFTPEDLEHYRTNRWGKVNAALSQDRRYLFLSASYGITLEEYAERVIKLGQSWGIKIDRALIFEGNENSYVAIRLGDYMVPLLGIEEPLIVNCLAIEKTH